jgi:hypothetical protein
MLVNVLNLERRTDRLAEFDKQSKEQGFEYERWQGIEIQNIPFLGISVSHKAIVSDAKEKGLPMVCIAEDDCIFSAPKAWEYYLKGTPESFDLYLGMIYEGVIKDNKVSSGFTGGLTLYTVHEKFYDAFLAMKSMNNLDRELGKYAHEFDYFVCNPMVCFQSNGFSDHKKSDATYDHLLVGRELFTG